jgi:hypothetical protein
MTWNSIMGFISSLALFLPIFFILFFRLGGYRTFPALLFYYTIVFTFNLQTEGFIKADPETIRFWSICNNLIDAPLMLVFLTYFSPSAAFTKKMKLIICSIIGFEVMVVLLKGFTMEAITIILGPTLVIVFFFSTYFFIRQTKITIAHHKAAGKAIIAASLLFAYGCYCILYLIYFVFKTKHVADTFLMYFIISTLSALVMCTGIFYERRRIQKLNELLQTRKELSDMYKDTKKAVPFRTAVLDFDKDHWN